MSTFPDEIHVYRHSNKDIAALSIHIQGDAALAFMQEVLRKGTNTTAQLPDYAVDLDKLLMREL